MSSRFAATQHSVASRKSPAATPVADVRPVARVHAAANEDTKTRAFAIFGDPLWGMAIATAILFAIFAALIAFS
jgi:hypothetical protein